MHIHTDDLHVCTDCVQLIANGETNPENTDEQTAAYLAAIEARWSDAQLHVVLSGDDDEEASFSWSPCDYCGSTLGGDRVKAAVLCEHAECAEVTSVIV